jgi:hypothetical protein
MRKIKLDVEGLQVDTFEVESGGVDGRGTVQGNMPVRNQDPGTLDCTGTSGSTYFSCTTPYPTNDNTCQGSCNGTCIYSCNAPPGVDCI